MNTRLSHDNGVLVGAKTADKEASFLRNASMRAEKQGAKPKTNGEATLGGEKKKTWWGCRGNEGA